MSPTDVGGKMMRTNNIKDKLKAAGRVAGVLSFAAVAAFGQSVALTAGASNTILPDGSTVPMWGYSCTATAPATCAALSPAAGTAWSPVVITVPPGNLTISLTNSPPG